MSVNALPDRTDRRWLLAEEDGSGVARQVCVGSSRRNAAPLPAAPPLGRWRRTARRWWRQLTALLASPRASNRAAESLPLGAEGRVLWTLQLKPNQIIRLEAGCPPRVLVVLEGIVWLTSTPACGDLLLREGDSQYLEEPRRWVIQALGKARVTLSDTTDATPPRAAAGGTRPPRGRPT